MTDFSTTTILLTTLSIIGLLACFFVGILQLNQSNESTSKLTFFGGITLIASTFVWGTVTWNLVQQQLQQNQVAQNDALRMISELPATAAGIPAQRSQENSAPSAATSARIVNDSERIAAKPRAFELQKLRKVVISALFKSENFNDPMGTPILIDLSQHPQKDQIKYLADERPGLFTVIYNVKGENGPKLIVYFPEVAGNQLIYTALSGPMGNAISRLVNSEMNALNN